MLPPDSPDDAGFRVGDFFFAGESEDAEIDDVEGFAVRGEFGGDGTFQAAAVVLERGGAVFAAFVDGKIVDFAGFGVDADDFEADWAHDFGDARSHVAEERDERFSGVAEGFAGGEIETVGGGMNSEGGDRFGWDLRMAGEEELGLRFSGRFEMRIGDGFSAGEIGPAVPHAFFDAPKMVGRAPDRAGAAVVVGVFGDVEMAVGGESEAERIAKTGGKLFWSGAVERKADDGAGGEDLAGNCPLIREGGSEGGESGGGFFASGFRGGRKFLVGNCQVERRDVVEIRMPPEPTHLAVVVADDAGVGEGSDAEIERAVGADGWGIDVVIALGRDSVEENFGFAVGVDAEDFAGAENGTGGDIERAVVEGDAGPWAGFAAAGDGFETGMGEFEEAGFGPDFAVGVAAFEDVEISGVVERDCGGEGEFAGDRFDLETGWESDIGGVDGAGRLKIGLPASGGRAENVATGLE